MSEQADPIQVGGRATCPKCGEDYSMADIHQCESFKPFFKHVEGKSNAELETIMSEPSKEAIEAARKLPFRVLNEREHYQAAEIIQSVIEKAREQWLIEGKAEVASGAAQPQRSPDEVIEIDEHGRVYPEGALDWMKPQPQRNELAADSALIDAVPPDDWQSAASSEPQEWTITKDSHFAYLKSSTHGSFMFPVSEFDQLQQVTLCINAALAAERETKSNYKREAMELARLLDAEREKREALQGFAEKARLYERQLLAAQAGIAQIRDHVKGYGERPPALFHVEEMCNAVDLSALEQHDAEVCKPIVETLKRYMVAMDALYNHDEATRMAVERYFGSLHPQAAFDALAQVKKAE